MDADCFPEDGNSHDSDSDDAPEDEEPEESNNSDCSADGDAGDMDDGADPDLGGAPLGGTETPIACPADAPATPDAGVLLGSPVPFDEDDVGADGVALGSDGGGNGDVLPDGGQVVPRRVRRLESHEWGAFYFTWVPPKVGHKNGAWQARCPYHRMRTVKCTKRCNVSEGSDPWATLGMLKFWCLQAMLHDRSRC